MWTVIKFDKKNLKNLKNEFTNFLGKDMIFYIPKISVQQINKQKKCFVEKFVLQDYLFCFHPKLKNSQSISKLKFSRGLKYFLGCNKTNQKEIINFINYCRKHEDKNGNLKQSFFSMYNCKKAKFISGPLTNMFFEIIEVQKKKIKILIGNTVTTISNNSNYLYQPL